MKNQQPLRHKNSAPGRNEIRPGVHFILLVFPCSFQYSLRMAQRILVDLALGF